MADEAAFAGPQPRTAPPADAALDAASEAGGQDELAPVGVVRPLVVAPMPPPVPGQPESAGPGRFYNRELSWTDFNERVFTEAANAARALLERVKFLAIYNANLDEFVMVRVPAIQNRARAGASEAGPDGIPPARLMTELRERAHGSLDRSAALLREVLVPALAAQGVYLLDYDRLSAAQTALLRDYFEREVFPVCTPLGFDPAHPFPFISNQSINLAVLLQDAELGRRFARLKIPNVLPRLVAVPSDPVETPSSPDAPPRQAFVWLDDLLKANLQAFFPGVTIEEAHVFRVLREAEMAIQELEANDLLELVENGLQQRRFGQVTALQVQPSMPGSLRTLLLEYLKVAGEDVYIVEGAPGLSSLMELTTMPRPDLKETPFAPHTPLEIAGHEDIFDAIRQQDILLHHPFDSFDPVTQFIQSAAEDPGVVAIKQTLYRVGQNSPIVEALLDAAASEKQVTVLVELKARFDEENNIDWARALERAGVHVVYGLLGLKTHCKLALVVRREREGLRRYVHIGTGNYNATTARLYTDLGLFTCRADIAADVSEIFNYLTGYSRQTEYRRLFVAPVSMRRQLLARIEREIARKRETGAGCLTFKMNALVDPEMIDALYRASAAGVRVDLIVRGICCLRPGIAGLSENVRVVSIVGRLLEHSRIYHFHNGGEDEVFIGSADLMPRNLDYRVETLAPVEDAGLRRYLIDEVLRGYLLDNVQASELGADGVYRRPPRPSGERFDMQAHLIATAERAARHDPDGESLPLVWRRPEPRPAWVDE